MTPMDADKKRIISGSYENALSKFSPFGDQIESSPRIQSRTTSPLSSYLCLQPATLNLDGLCPRRLKQPNSPSFPMSQKKLLTLSTLALSGLSAQASLVAHFDFEEGSGATTSSQVGGWTGPFSGNPQWVSTSLAPVPSGTTAALAFDGAGDWIISDFAGIGGSGDRSVSFWVSSTNDTQNTGIVAWGDSTTPNGRKWHVRLNNSAGNGPIGAIRTEIQGSYEIDGSSLTDGNWHHVVSTYSSGGTFGSGQVSHYIDGVLFSDGETNTGGNGVLVNTLTSPTVSGSTYPVVLGGRHQGTALASFSGMIDEVRIYDHALDAGEVQALYQVPEPSTGLLAGLALSLGLLARRRS